MALLAILFMVLFQLNTIQRLTETKLLAPCNRYCHQFQLNTIQRLTETETIFVKHAKMASSN